MLEHSCLHIDGWIQTALAAAPGLAQAPGKVWIRRITDANSKPVGFVRFEGKARPAWFSWLRTVRLEVYETEDASFLMSLARSWGMLRIWDLHDAEERRVGSIYPPSLVDSEGQRRGYFDLPGREPGRIIDPGNHLLASFRKNACSDLEVTFMPEPTANPFLRMLLLGGILTLDPVPNR